MIRLELKAERRGRFCVVSRRKMAKSSMPQYNLRSLRKFLFSIFFISTIMLFVNSSVFFGDSLFISSYSSSEVNQSTADRPGKIDIIINRKTTVVNKLKFSRAKRFVRRPWSDTSDCFNFTIRRMRRHNLAPVALASYPGSGNTWIRQLIEAASGIYTGSVYKDTNLYLHGFWGELADWDSGETCVQKTHGYNSDHIQSFSGGRAILVNRNPYDSILSFHNFLYGGHTGYAPSDNFQRPIWPLFLMDQTRRWLGTAVNWSRHSTELLTVNYEDFKVDPLPPLRQILQFLQLPVDEDRLSCVQKYPQRTFQRTRRLEDLPDEKVIFPELARRPLDRAIRYVDYITQQLNKRPLPLESYSYYNHSGRKSSPHVQQEDKDWMEWITGQLRFQLQSVVDDPLTRIFRRQAESVTFYDWKIPFDSQFSESKQLEMDFNTGAPDFIQRIRHSNISTFLDNYVVEIPV